MPSPLFPRAIRQRLRELLDRVDRILDGKSRSPSTPAQITPTNTLWIFVSGSQEARHVNDIIFGVDVLRKRGVDPRHIFIFSDHKDNATHLGPYGITQHVYPTSDLSARLAVAEKHSFAVLIATGDGDENGIATTPPAGISLNAVTKAVRGCSGIEAGIIVLCQCFGGVFNFADATVDPPLILIGATNLNMSLSYMATLAAPIMRTDGTPGLQQWEANVFMLHFLGWFTQPADVDGDGRPTIMDAFKYAGVRSNNQLRNMKSLAYVGLDALLPAFRAALQEVENAKQQNKPADEVKKLTMDADAMAIILEKGLTSLHLHQEPWILHAALARRIHL